MEEDHIGGGEEDKLDKSIVLDLKCLQNIQVEISNMKTEPWRYEYFKGQLKKDNPIKETVNE